MNIDELTRFFHGSLKMKKIVLTGILAGLAILIVAMLLNLLFNLVFPSLQAEYENANLFRPWSDPKMSIFFAYPFVLGIVLAWFWDKTKSLFKQKSFWNRGFSFGLMYWIIASIPGMIITYSSFQLSLLIVLSWTIMGFVEAVCAGLICAAMNK